MSPDADMEIKKQIEQLKSELESLESKLRKDKLEDS